MTTFAQLWNDYQLNWEPTEFGGINVIRILPEKVWKPDIVLFNKSAPTRTVLMPRARGILEQRDPSVCLSHGAAA